MNSFVRRLSCLTCWASNFLKLEVLTILDNALLDVVDRKIDRPVFFFSFALGMSIGLQLLDNPMGTKPIFGHGSLPNYCILGSYIEIETKHIK